MIPLVRITDSTVEELCKKYCGENYIAYAGNRDNGFTGIVTTWANPFEAKADVLAKCELYGAPYMYSGNVATSSLTINELKEIAEAVHEKNCLVSSAYLSSAQQRFDLQKVGFDFFNPRVIGDLYNLSSLGSDYNDFNTNGTIVNGVLLLAQGNTITLAGTLNTVKLASAELNIKFRGSLNYKFDNSSLGETIISDGTLSFSEFTYFLNKQVNLVITATEETQVFEIDFKVQKC
jgi:hypothetical protein